ncbi:Long-chain fatty acid transport protein [Tenacibaculum sp. MAR_2009_124]|uniref:OmpP1/FadL family transporter n=1 Tax=Tenacibaculum sp. MAR_2009_124 TaxID=1250059 RepID=UPI000896D561|nr:outer membrane protein transport protein [Tenacibaculum sp. MAR_2009_124]SEB67122.1 Long-chain fatty acid transport protein [Tenacibaculum sp. MAR_2009_124]
MKRLLALGVLLGASLNSFSQSLNYNDLGLLFSQDDNYGTARFEAMSGAFGALGGDVSAFGINPAGSAVATSSSASVTLSNKNTDYASLYYGSSSNSVNDSFNLSQAGAILTFETNSNDWDRVAFTANYRIKSDYSSFYRVRGNSQILPYNQEHLDDTGNPKVQFNGSIEQDFSAEKRGQSSVMNFGFSAVHQSKLFIGGSLNFHDIDFNRISRLRELNDDVNGNVLVADNLIDTYVQGNGFSLSLGFIYKFNQNVRLGLAYETPTWYNEITEDFFDDLTHGAVDNLGFDKVTAIPIEEGAIYRFRTNSRITASGAYIFGKQGLISFDYTYKDYQNLKYRENDSSFIDANQNFATDYRATHSLNIGTEWRFDRLSLRGGYHYSKNPNLLAALGGSVNDDNVRGFSAGLGYNFGNMKIDLSYSKFENREFETLYNLGDIMLDNDTSRVSGTLTINL